jgi:putative SOS response-associated peptidase YedK
MCFHSKQSKKAQAVEERFNAKIENVSIFQATEHVNAFGHPKTPVIIDKSPTTIKHYNWGLIPSWAKDDEVKKFTINARIETIKEKPSFRNSVNKRCLVLSNGFYEWKWLDSAGKKKQKHLISLANDELYAYGGIYSEWIDRVTGEIVNTYSIVTTDANPLVASIHKKKRMPVILNKEDETSWLEGEEISDFAYPYSPNLIALPI